MDQYAALMDHHPTEEDLIDHLFGDTAPAEAGRLRTHLAHCEACRAEYETLQETLRLAARVEAPEPEPGFEQALWARIQPALAPASRGWTSKPFVPLAAWAALVVAVVALGATWAGEERTPATPEMVAASVPSDAPHVEGVRERVLLSALDQHFGQTEVLLVELLNAPAVAVRDASNGRLQFERTAAIDLVASGRLFRETAEQTGQQQFADVLDELESVLVEVARSPDQLALDEMDAWRARIKDQSLLFKVRAVANEIRERQDGLGAVNKGAL